MTLERSDDIISRASAALDRATQNRIHGRVGQQVRGVSRAGRANGVQGGLKVRLAAIGAVNLIILVVAAVVGIAVMPLGMFGALAVMLLMLACTLLIAFAPAQPVPSAERLVRTDIRSLPAQTHRWLDAQRPALPAPAVLVADRIGERLATLQGQMTALDEDAPAAAEVRRLVGEQLPEFVRDYAKVPPAMRSTPRNGRTPDQQLVDGLEVIEREIGAMSDHLAQGDLDALQTRGRYLEIKYQGEQ